MGGGAWWQWAGLVSQSSSADECIVPGHTTPHRTTAAPLSYLCVSQQQLRRGAVRGQHQVEVGLEEGAGQALARRVTLHRSNVVAPQAVEQQAGAVGGAGARALAELLHEPGHKGRAQLKPQGQLGAGGGQQLHSARGVLPAGQPHVLAAHAHGAVA